jgi:hypothetical protein
MAIFSFMAGLRRAWIGNCPCLYRLAGHLPIATFVD